MNYIQADADGRIIGFVEAPDSFDPTSDSYTYTPQPGEVSIQDDINIGEIQNHLFTGGRVKAKTEHNGFDKMSARSNLRDRVEMRNVPKGTTIDVLGHGMYTVDDGVVDLVFSEPGEYSISVDPFPYKPFEVTIHVD